MLQIFAKKKILHVMKFLPVSKGTNKKASPMRGIEPRSLRSFQETLKAQYDSHYTTSEVGQFPYHGLMNAGFLIHIK